MTAMMTVTQPPTLAQSRQPGPARIIVTIDGPAGTGKTTVAHMLARRLGVHFLDTGAMYRAAAVLVIEQGIDRNDALAVCAAVRAAAISFDWSVSPPEILARTYRGPMPLSRRIRDADVTAIVAPLSAIVELRAIMVADQQRIASEHPRLVTEGRDQGSVVFPGADAKFFLNASARVRAARRADELRKAGIDADDEQLLREIEQRDEVDRNKPVGALVKPADAVEIDTSVLTRDQVIDRLEQLVRLKVPGLPPGDGKTGGGA